MRRGRTREGECMGNRAMVYIYVYIYNIRYHMNMYC